MFFFECVIFDWKPPQQVHQQVVLAAKLARIVLERIDKC